MERIKLSKDDWIEAKQAATESIKQALRMLALNKELLKLADKHIKILDNAQ